MCKARLGDQGLFPLPLRDRSEEHTSELQSRLHLVCRLLLEKKKNATNLERPECCYRSQSAPAPHTGPFGRLCRSTGPARAGNLRSYTHSTAAFPGGLRALVA